MNMIPRHQWQRALCLQPKEELINAAKAFAPIVCSTKTSLNPVWVCSACAMGSSRSAQIGDENNFNARYSR